MQIGEILHAILCAIGDIVRRAARDTTRTDPPAPAAPASPRRPGRDERRVTDIKIEPLTAEAFAPFGDVFTPPETPGRLYCADALANLRPGAKPSLSLAHKDAVAALPLTVTQMERHEFSSQTFVPMQDAGMLVIVAPHAADGGPDMGRARLPLPGRRRGTRAGRI